LLPVKNLPAAQRKMRAMTPAHTALPPALPPYLQPLGVGVYTVDTGFHRDHFDAAYLLVHAGRAAFVDTGTAFAVPRLLGALAALGLGVDAVDWVIPTHVHLDHAGGVGQLMQALPHARCLVHPRGARHLVDPSALWAGASAVYGDAEMQRSYGALLPVPESRVVQSTDNGTVQLADRLLVLAHTPGHAKHHHCVWDATTRTWFTGDTFGLSYREFDAAVGPWLLPSATPVQFEPDALRTSVQRLLAVQPLHLALTHYGRVGGSVAEVQRLGTLLLGLLGEMEALGHASRAVPEPHRHQQLVQGQLAIFTRSLQAHGCTLPPARVAELLSIDLELNAQGMAVWLDR
jgi:glyoxylase-like metal-dependent hydrolase (beta-lactamase superfamily II)